MKRFYYVSIFVLSLFAIVQIAHAVMIDETIQLFPSFPDPATTGNVANLMTFDATQNISGDHPVASLYKMTPNFTTDAGVPVVQYFTAGGTITNKQTPYIYDITAVAASYITKSDTDGIAPLLQDAFFDNVRVQQTAGSATSKWLPISFLSRPGTETTNGASLTTGTTYAVFSKPAMSASGAGGRLTQSRTALGVMEPLISETGGGDVIIPENIGVDVENMVTGNVNMSLRSAGPQVQMQHAGPVRIGSLGSPRSTLQLDGSLTIKRTAVNDANYTVQSNDYLVVYTSLSTARTVTLPSASSVGEGKIYIVKDESGNAGAKNIKITANEGIDGSSTPQLINRKYGSLTLYSSGSGWFTLSN